MTLTTPKAPASPPVDGEGSRGNYTPYRSIADCDTAAIRAVRLLEDAEEFNANCEECGGEGVPELCGVCFPFFDAARVERRLVMQSLAALSSPPSDEPAKLREALVRLTDALAKVSPISTHDTADYAELTFGEHQTQAMTMAPDDWNDIEAAYLDARSARAALKDPAS